MASPNHYDLISIGSGEAGKFIAWTLASKGKKCAVIEDTYIGGSCPNVACLPSKNVIYSASAVHNARLPAFGLPISTAPVHLKTVIDRKRAMVDGLIDMHKGKFQGSGAELIMGHGRFVGDKSVEVSQSTGLSLTLTAENIVICTGSRATIDEHVPGLKQANPLTHIDILELDNLPSHLIVLGGGYIGLELAQAFRRLGSEVSVIEHNPRVLKKEDEDVSQLLETLLTEEGIKFYTSAKVTSVNRISGNEVVVKGSTAWGPFELNGSHILAAAGRLPNNDNVGIETTTVELTSSKHIKVDEYLRTTSPGVFAVGDCAGSPYFTHVAYDDFRVVTDQIIGTGKRSTKDRQVPSTLFTSPEVAQVGLREHEAKSAGIKYRLTKIPIAVVLRTRTMEGAKGFLKALIADNDTILGFTAVGPGVGELLPVIQLAMQERICYQTIAGLILTHPTMNEGLTSLFGAVPPLA